MTEFNDLDAYNAVVLAKFWSGYGDYTDTEPVGTRRTQAGFTITLVGQYNEAEATWKKPDYRYYDDGNQGWSGTSHLIFKVEKGNETRFYKKEGTCSSYGHDSWDGTFRRVHATPKVVEVWEYK